MANEDVAVVAVQVAAKDKGDELVSISEAGRKLGIDGSVVWWWKYGWLPDCGRGPRNAILVSLDRAHALARLREKRGKRGRRLVPRDINVEEIIAATA